eukprot:TRINITY_DN6598_c0_g1_i1.p1 TRINITY_DN6598_c0_g1~~TRINITY_DN6598_c0_g1_i1.p1  ORF type:complete len:541 (+),score=177.46 TRINITY_DN6598_c0_g1_i1:565-2187(+)
MPHYIPVGLQKFFQRSLGIGGPHRLTRDECPPASVILRNRKIMNHLVRLGSIQIAGRPRFCGTSFLTLQQRQNVRSLHISTSPLAKAKVSAVKPAKKKIASAKTKTVKVEELPEDLDDEIPQSALASALEKKAKKAAKLTKTYSIAEETPKTTKKSLSEEEPQSSAKVSKKATKAPSKSDLIIKTKESPKAKKLSSTSKKASAVSIKEEDIDDVVLETPSKKAKKVAKAAAPTKSTKKSSKKQKEEEEEDDEDDDEEYLTAEQLEDMYPEESEHERALLERVNREVDEMEAKKAKKAAKQKRTSAGSRTASEMPSPLTDIDVDPEAAIKRAAAEAESLSSPEQSIQMELMRMIVKLLKEEGGRDIVAIDVSKKTNWVNSMIVVTGMVSRHNVALANKIRSEMKNGGLVKSTKIERNEDDEWIIVNCGSLIVEIMTEEQRAALDLERLWVLKQDEIEALAADTEATEFTYDDEDAVKVEPGTIPETKKKGNSAMSQQYNDFYDDDDMDLDIDDDDSTPVRVMEEYKSKAQEKKAKRKGLKK